ncbi:MAG: glycosyltransferase, partial [Candidatus Hydrothermae bacterium]|nr:glycosyltransferase [Candidatus Hydrothermae bacterium]
MIRVLVLSDLSAVHTPRFVEALQQRGMVVGCLSLEPFPSEAHPYGIYVPPRIPHPLRARYISSVDRVKGAVYAFRPDVLVPVHLPNYGLLAWLIRPRVPVYLVAWGSDLLYTAEKTPVHRWVTRRIVKAAQAWNVDALEMERVLIQRYHIPPERIDRITWGLQAGWLDGVPERSHAHRWDIFSHRRLDPDMDPLTLIHAFHHARQEGYPGRLILAGDGSLRTRVLET